MGLRWIRALLAGASAAQVTVRPDSRAMPGIIGTALNDVARARSKLLDKRGLVTVAGDQGCYSLFVRRLRRLETRIGWKSEFG